MGIRPISLALLCVLVGPWRAAAGATPNDASEFFGPDRVWDFHITVSAEDWDAMMPGQAARPGPGGPGGGGPGGGRGGPHVKNEYPWVRATLRFGASTLKDVGLRFKGNSSFRAPGNGGVKYPLKFDFNRFVDGQRLAGLAQLNLSNSAMGHSQAREAIAYAVMRDAGLPASRTAFVKVHLTVPGRMEGRYVGLYTAVEDVGKAFLKGHFDDDAKGMLLKPEGARDFPYRGDDWPAYRNLSPKDAPKDPPTAAHAARLVAFAKLIHQADDAAFRTEIPRLLDVDRFLRFIAANGALANMDSFLCTGHNFYLYLDAKTDRFTFIPWDLNEAFAGFQAPGDGERQANLSIAHPHAGANRLIERVLAIPENDAAYRKHLAAIVVGPMSVAAIDARLTAIEAACKEAAEAERAAMGNARPGRPGDVRPGPAGPAMRGRPELREFVAKRVASIERQLKGEAKGEVLEMQRRPGGSPPGPGPDPRPPQRI